jgi:protein TonB
VPLHKATIARETVLTAYPNRRGEDADLPGESNRARTIAQRQLVTLTNDSALIRALQELSADNVAVHVVSDMRSLSDELLQHAGAVALIDASSLDIPVEGAVDAITTQFPDLRLMIAGHSAEQNVLARRIADQSVFRFVHKPASPQRLKLFLDAAARPADSQRGRTAAEPAFGDSPSLARIDTAVRGRSPMTLALVGVAVIAAIAVGAWVMLKDGKPAAPAAATATQAAAPAPTTATSTSPAAMALIRKGDRAFADGRYVALDGSSAAEFYREALKVEPENQIARSGFDRSLDYGTRRAEEAVLAGKLNEAAAISEALRPLTPSSSRLNFLNSQIEKEQARINADASLRAANDARQGQIRDALAQMTERMRRNALLDPPTHSAVSHFREAEALSPADPSVRSARENLVGALLTAADGELTARRAPAARRLIEAAATLNSSASGLDVMRKRLDEFAEQQQAAAEAEATRARNAEIAAQAATAAAAAKPTAPVAVPAAPAVAAPSVVLATTLKAVRTENPDYPPRALEQLVSGWVEMEFTVARDGSVQDIVVTNSEPRRTFDSAAVAAMRRYRYQPVVRNGELVAQRARLRMRFTAQDGR